MTPTTNPLTVEAVSGPPTPTRRRRAVRGYTRQFTPTDKGKRYLLDRIPARLWVTARAQAKREGRSMRALVLQLLTEYVERAA